MNWRVVAIISSMSAIMAAFDSSVPRMISMYFDITFSSSGRGRLSALAPPGRTSDPQIDTAPEKSLAATQPIPPAHASPVKPAPSDD